MNRNTRFDEYCERKTERARRTTVPGFRTLQPAHASPALVPIGSAWTERLFDGPFYVRRSAPGTPAVSLVFVESREGNTVADTPASLGGGAGDEHLVYEGLSRVAADAVLAGAHTVGENTFFSVWHPELVALRRKLRATRHPAQVVVTGRAASHLAHALIASVPDVPLFVLTSSGRAAQPDQALRHRDWVHVIDCGDPLDLRAGLLALQRDFGIDTVSAVGGRRTAQSLIAAGLAGDLYLTTSPISAGEPGSQLLLPDTHHRRLVLSKTGIGEDRGVLFEHWALHDDADTARRSQ